MSEYTPTTAEVRKGSYAEKINFGQFVYDVKRDITNEQFDRWLFQHDLEVIAEYNRRNLLLAEIRKIDDELEAYGA